ncbi:MAG: threonine synthase, partial [Cyanobacteria bacterium P01_F01_bin.33]
MTQTATLAPDTVLSSPSLAQHVRKLKCRECGALYEPQALHVCEFCFGPLEVAYDYDFL